MEHRRCSYCGQPYDEDDVQHDEPAQDDHWPVLEHARRAGLVPGAVDLDDYTPGTDAAS